MSGDLLVVFPDPPPPLLAQTLDLGGYRWKAVGNAAVATQHEPSDGWLGAVVCADTDPDDAFSVCRVLRKRDTPLEPILLLVSGAQLAELEVREELVDDLCLPPLHPPEAQARRRRSARRAGGVRRPGAQPRDLSGRPRRSSARPHVHGVRAAEVLRAPPGQGVHT